MTDYDTKDISTDFQFKEGEFDDYLKTVGMLSSFQELPLSLRKAVTESATNLRKIDLLGRKIQKDDLETLEGSEQSTAAVNDAFKKNVETELGEVDNEFRKNNGDWFVSGVKELVKWAGDNGEMSPVGGSNITDNAEKYARRLGQAGEYFSKMSENTYPQVEREKMEKYLKEERPKTLGRMSKIANIDLAGSVTSIPNLKRVAA